jgi:hypothetical protein
VEIEQVGAGDVGFDHLFQTRFEIIKDIGTSGSCMAAGIARCSDDLALWTNTALSVSGTGSGQSFCVSATKPEEFYRITTSP